MSRTQVPDALKAALDFEQKGKNFYSKTASEVTDALSRKLFTSLAEDEVRHAERIQAIYSALEQGAAWPEAKAFQRGLEKEIREFFEKHKGTLSKQTGNIQGYEFSMQMEKTGIELYSKFSKETANPTEREFFKALIVEERSHLEALQNVYFYLTQTGDWLQEDESKHWNWMNL